MAKKIVILEDNADRRLEMERCLKDRFYQFDLFFFDNSQEMTHFLDTHLQDTLVICLDHDLELKAGPEHMVDPGTGRQVADYLASKAPVCPVIIHTTNSPAGQGMEAVLHEAHWKTQRISPFGDLEWISSRWFPVVRRAIVGPTRNGVVR